LGFYYSGGFMVEEESKKGFGNSHLIMSNPIKGECIIGIYDAEGVLHETYNGPKSKHSKEEKSVWGHFFEYLKNKFNPTKYQEFEDEELEIFKEKIRELVGEHVYLVPAETKEEYYSFKNSLREQSKFEEPEIVEKYKIHRIDEEHPYHMEETEDHFEIDIFDNFTEEDAEEVIRYFCKDIFKKPEE
jgi:hypothetical protein